MRNHFIYIFFFLNHFILFSQQNDSIGITYSYYEEAITLLNDGRFVYQIAHCDICSSRGESDVVSFGRYVKYKNKAYYLFSSPLIRTSILECSVLENKIDLEDSIRIELNSPFEKNKGNSIFEKNAVFYQISIRYHIDSKKDLSEITDTNLFYNTFFPNEETGSYQPTYTFWNNIFVVPKLKFPIIEFTVRIYPTDSYRVYHHFLQFKFSLEDTNANNIQVDIPHFSFQNFCYKYFYYKELRILNKNMVALDGIVLRKNDMGGKRKLKKIRNWQYNPFNAKDPYETDE